jgi:hypothetical protein
MAIHTLLFKAAVMGLLAFEWMPLAGDWGRKRDKVHENKRDIFSFPNSSDLKMNDREQMSLFDT